MLCPTPGCRQREICAVDYNDENSKWVAQEGIFVKPNTAPKNTDDEHDEL